MRLIFLSAVICVFSACADNNAGKVKESGNKEATASAQQGELLFKTNCSQCHQPKKDFVGPSLAGVESRWKNKELLYEFVRNSAAVIPRDEYAATLYKKWNESPMLPFPDLTDADIAAILQYCNVAP